MSIRSIRPMLMLTGATALLVAVATTSHALQGWTPLPAAPAQAPMPLAAPTPAMWPAPTAQPSVASARAAQAAHDASFEYHWESGSGSLFGPSLQRFPQDPADSLYREARSLMNRGEYRKAAAMFARVVDHKPASAYAADALYWQAFMLYRIGGTADLRQAGQLLESRKSRFPNARSEGEAATLATRIAGALAARGDASASARVAQSASSGTAGCDSEELSVRASALSALMRSDPDAAQTHLARVLERKDECSVSLRKNAVVMLGSKGDDASKTRLASVVRNDPSSEVRAEAVSYLARASGDEVVAALDQVIRSDDDERVRRSAVRALGAQEGPRARAAIRALVERSEAPEALRLEALSTFDRGSGYAYASVACAGQNCENVTYVRAPTPPTPPATPRPAVAPLPSPVGVTSSSQAEREAERAAAQADREAERAAAQAMRLVDAANGQHVTVRRISAEDAAWLRGVYPRLETTRLKSRAVAVLARSGDEATLTWLMNMVSREEESADVRATVLSRLGRDLPIVSLNRLYDNAANRTVRSQIVSTLGDRSEPEATDKLIEIVRTGTDPQLRRSAINALGRKKDPRTTQLLLELIDK